MTKKEHLLNDTAISSKEEDLFNFSHYAEKVNTIIQKNTKNSECIVIGIQGKWGDGKTSFMNLIKNKLAEFEDEEDNKRILKYDFNPWRYSTEDEMLFDFFDGLSKTLLLDKKENFKKAGKLIKRFGRYLKAVKLSASVGILNNNAKVTFEPHRILEALGEDLEGETPTLENIKEQIDSELEKSDYKIAIYIDDIDRLDKDEIYTLLKIIKLNANFKNLIYIITLDPEQVAKAIHHRYGNKKKDGRLFLEKIINIPIVLPKIEKEDLQLFFENKFKHITSLLNFQDKDEEYRNILYTFNSLKFTTPREFIRVLNSFFIGAFAIGEEVNLLDLFLIEYLKLTNEKCYEDIRNYSTTLSLDTIFSETGNINELIDFDKTSNSGIRTFKNILVEKHNVQEEILDKLFPKINQLQNKSSDYIKNLRINTSEHFNKYFSYHIVGKISEKKVKEIQANIENNNDKNIVTILTDLFKENENTFKVVLKIDGLLDEYKEHNNKAFFFKTLIDNINIIPDIEKDIFGLDYRLRIIEKIAIILNESNRNSDKIILDLAENLNYNNLCYYTQKFKKEKLRVELNKLIIKKVKNESGVDNPFYINPLDPPNKMILGIWNNSDITSFNTYLEKSLNKENIKLFIRNFPNIYNGNQINAFDSKTYDFMKSIVDTAYIYEKLIKYYPDLKNAEYDYKNISHSPDFDNNTEEDTILQFLYWYNKDKEQTDKISLLLK